MKSLRMYAIVDHWKQKKYCSVQKRTSYFKMLPATMCRDITELAALMWS